MRYLLIMGMLVSQAAFSQDMIIRRDSTKILCKIIGSDSVHFFYNLPAEKERFTQSIKKTEVLTCLYGSEPIKTNSQSDPGSPGREEKKIGFDKLSLGIGAGFDYGGTFGFRMLAYPHKNVGLFAAGGYALIGFAYNAGIKLRHIPKDTKFKRINPFFTAMYGYNAVLMVSNAEQYNKIFYGCTAGVGVDFRMSNGCWSFALLIPFRGDQVDNYVNSIHNLHITQDLLPFGISIGYNFMLNKQAEEDK